MKSSFKKIQGAILIFFLFYFEHCAISAPEDITFMPEGKIYKYYKALCTHFDAGYKYLILGVLIVKIL